MVSPQDEVVSLLYKKGVSVAMLPETIFGGCNTAWNQGFQDLCEWKFH